MSLLDMITGGVQMPYVGQSYAVDVDGLPEEAIYRHVVSATREDWPGANIDDIVSMFNGRHATLPYYSTSDGEQSEFPEREQYFVQRDGMWKDIYAGPVEEKKDNLTKALAIYLNADIHSTESTAKLAGFFGNEYDGKHKAEYNMGRGLRDAVLGANSRGSRSYKQGLNCGNALCGSERETLKKYISLFSKGGLPYS